MFKLRQLFGGRKENQDGLELTHLESRKVHVRLDVRPICRTGIPSELPINIVAIASPAREGRDVDFRSIAVPNAIIPQGKDDNLRDTIQNWQDNLCDQAGCGPKGENCKRRTKVQNFVAESIEHNRWG